MKVQSQKQKIVRPIIVVYPHDIRPGPGNRIGVYFPDSGQILLCGEFKDAFASLVREYGEALQFKKTSGENFYGVLNFTAYTSKTAYAAAMRLRGIVSKCFQTEALLQRAEDNATVLKCVCSH